MTPIKLKAIKNEDWIDGDVFIYSIYAIYPTCGVCICSDLNEETALEIVRRYNGYPDQQKLIEQFVGVCKTASHLITNHSEGNHRAFIESKNEIDDVITAAKELKEKK